MSNTPEKKSHLQEKHIHETLDTFITLCELLSLETPSKTRKTDNITSLVEGSFRRNLQRLQAIHLLINGTDVFAGSAREIMRNMLEDTIIVQYILGATGEDEAEELATRFFDFQWVQLQDDLDFYNRIGVSFEKRGLTERVKQIEMELPRVIEKYSTSRRPFKDKNGLAHSWIRKGVDDLLGEMKQRDGEESDRIELLARMYTEGNRSTHFNPHAILELLELDTDKFHHVDQRIIGYTSFVMAGLCMCWLMRAYVDGVPPSETWKDLPELEKKLDEVENFLSYCITHIAELHSH